MNPTAEAAARILTDAGYECYLVGGAVRDSLRGEEPSDVDVATNANPLQVKQVFRAAGWGTYATGEKHGTVTLVQPGTNQKVECTTYRTEGKYSDGRRPDEVRFAKTIEEDLARRDFTINAMALNPLTGQVVDPFGGQYDLEAGIIRAVGDPKARFMEDGLRPFRAARFAAKFQFSIEQATAKAMMDPEVHAVAAKVASERVRDEFMKAMATSDPSGFVWVLDHTGLLQIFLPEFRLLHNLPQPKAHHIFTADVHSLAACEAAPIEDPFLRWVALLHDIGKPASYNGNSNEPHFYGHQDTGAEIIEAVMRRMKGWSVEEINAARCLVQNHMGLMGYGPHWTDAQVRRWVRRVGEDLVPRQIALARADLIAHGPQKAPEVAALDHLEARLKTMPAPKPSVAMLKVNGHDVMATGRQGRAIGEALEALLEMVIDDPTKNARETLLAELEAMK